MKNIINKIAVGLFTCGLVTGVTAEEYLSYQFVSNAGKQKASSPLTTSDYYSDQEIVLGNDDQIEVINCGHKRATALLAKIDYGDGFLLVVKATSPDDLSTFPVIKGPCKVTIGARLVAMYQSYSRYNSGWYGDITTGGKLISSYRITRAKVPKGANITVLPETSSDLNLVLESSDDLVGWNADVLGNKPTANRKKFYRLRARQQ